MSGCGGGGGGEDIRGKNTYVNGCRCVVRVLTLPVQRRETLVYFVVHEEVIYSRSQWICIGLCVRLFHFDSWLFRLEASKRTSSLFMRKSN